MSETKITQFTYEDENGNKYTMEAGGGTSYSISLSGSATMTGDTKISSDGTAIVIIKVPQGYGSPTITSTNASIVFNNKVSTLQYMLILANATGNVTLSVTLNPITKGSLINLYLGNTAVAYGTMNEYRILRQISGSKYLVVAMYEPTTSQQFNPSGSGQTYSSSSLDTYLNSTWYNTLSTTAKAAIVSQTISQYKYSSGSTSTSHMSYATYSSKALVGSLSRYVYALDVEDIEMYFGGTGGSASATTQGTYTTSDLMTLFYKSTGTISGKYFWLRSANSSNSSNCWYVDGHSGYVNSNYYYNCFAVRPAFTIDLSKIDYSIVE